MNTRSEKAFTLIELLVVISIIAVLMSILMPALGRVKEQAKKVVCSNSLHQTGIALGTYATDNRGRSPKAVPNDRDPFKYHHYFRDASSTGNFLLQGTSFLPKYIGQNINQTALFALIASELLEPEYLFCPAAKGKSHIGFEQYSDLMDEQNANYPRTQNSQDFVFDTLTDPMLRSSFAFGYCYWVGYEIATNTGSNSVSKLNKFNKSIAKNANSRGDTVAATDLIISNEVDSDSAQKPASAQMIQGEFTCVNHLRSTEIAGGNVLYNDASVQWHGMDSMVSQQNSSASGVDAFERFRVLIKTDPMGDGFNYWF